ncbi:hypothetical protein OAR92_00630, partial [Porticoccaceae bacterium]|nr:hypothetical protein [Porticoccaceae bacterium]
AAINLFSSAMADQFDYQDEWPEDQWPDYDSDFEPEDSHSGALSQYYGPVVLCQNWINNVLFVRRVSYPNQGCFDETINTFTGQVVNVSPAPCYC